MTIFFLIKIERIITILVYYLFFFFFLLKFYESLFCICIFFLCVYTIIITIVIIEIIINIKRVFDILTQKIDRKKKKHLVVCNNNKNC